MYEENVLVHHGILGMRWGVRRYQNSDGSLTAAGRKRYAKLEKKRSKAENKIAKITGKGTSSSRPTFEMQEKREMRRAADDVETMTVEDIKKIIDRLDMENKMLDIIDKRYNRGKTFDARKAIGSGLEATLKSLTSTASKNSIKKLAKALGTDIFDEKQKQKNNND